MQFYRETLALDACPVYNVGFLDSRGYALLFAKSHTLAFEIILDVAADFQWFRCHKDYFNTSKLRQDVSQRSGRPSVGQVAADDDRGVVHAPQLTHDRIDVEKRLG